MTVEIYNHSMGDIKRIKQGVECHLIDADCDKCPYFVKNGEVNLQCETSLLSEIDNLLLAISGSVKAKLIELWQLSEKQVYWIEDRNGRVAPEVIFNLPGLWWETDGTSKEIMTIPLARLSNGYAPVIAKLNTHYMKTWRAWTRRPELWEMEAAKWLEE